MEAAEFDFLLDQIRVQAEQLSEQIKVARRGRGDSFLELTRHHLEAIERSRADIAARYPKAVHAMQKVALERKAATLAEFVSVLHTWVIHFTPDVGRLDIPVGITYLVDALSDVLLDVQVDPVIHLDDDRMYSVISPVEWWSDQFALLGVNFAGPRKPVILNLPGADPMNVVLAPILGHEVGHPVVNQKDLLTDFNGRVDQAQLRPIWDDCLRFGIDEPDLRKIWGSWIEELLCDALAVATTGPSMLYASLAFLPGSDAGRASVQHPDPARRISLTLTQLDALGWMASLDADATEVMSWARHLASLPTTSAANGLQPVLARLGDAIQIAAPHVWDLATELCSAHLFEPAAYSEVRKAALDLLRHGVPPVEVDGSPLSPWSIILATWEYGLEQFAGQPAGIPDVVADRDLNRFSLKAIELASVLRFWSEL